MVRYVHFLSTAPCTAQNCIAITSNHHIRITSHTHTFNISVISYLTSDCDRSIHFRLQTGGGGGGGGTGGGATTSAGTLHIPMTSQHAHSISMSSQNGAEWSHLVHLVDGSEGAGSGSSGSGSASGSGSDGDKEGTREFDLEDYALECLHVYHLITVKMKKNESKKRMNVNIKIEKRIVRSRQKKYRHCHR